MFQKDFKEFIELLIKNQVEYLIVGGYAVIAYGYPRLTGDLDVWYNRTPHNSKRLLKTINDFGMGSLGFKEEDFLKDGQVVQLGVSPLRIDLINKIDGVTFAECYASKQISNWSGTDVDFINLEHLLKNKKASGRNKDLDDIENLSD